MPSYSNAVAQTSQATTVSSGNLVISYSNISLIPGVPHKYQIEIERVFTSDRDGSSAIVTAFLSDAGVSVEDKRNIFIIPELDSNNSNAVLWTVNETNKTITINNTNLALRNYPTPSYGSHPDIKVPTIIDGQVVTIRRKTISNTPLVTWTAGTTLTSNQLNLETTQLLYILQEVLDRVYRQISISGDIVSQIADNSVTTSKIVDLNVTTGKLNNLSVTDAKLATDSVITSKILNQNVTTAKIADYNITPIKLINTTQAWSLTGTLALTNIDNTAGGTLVGNKNYVLGRVSRHGIITKDSSNVTSTQPNTTGVAGANEVDDSVSNQDGGIWFNPMDGGLRVRVLDKWVRITGTPLTINDYISTGSTAQTKTGNLNISSQLQVLDGLLRVDRSTNGPSFIATGPSSNLQIKHTTGNTNLTMYNSSGGGFIFNTLVSGNETEQIRINSNGNFGIGTNNPAVSLDVNGRGRFVSAGSGVTSGAVTLREDASNNPAYIQWVNNSNSTNRGNLVVDASSNMNFITGLNERMRIDSSGNVGIGTSNPSEKLEVTGNIKASGNLTLGTSTMTTPSGSAPIFGCRAWVNFNGTSRSDVNATYSYPTSDPNKVTVTLNNHGYLVGHQINVTVTTGGGESGNTYVTDVINSNTFKYWTAQAATTNRSGNVTLNRSTINSSGNIHSVSYMTNATYPYGKYAINFLTEMPSGNYCSTLSYSSETVNNGTTTEHALGWITGMDSKYFQCNFWHSNNSTVTVNKSIVNIAIFI